MARLAVCSGLILGATLVGLHGPGPRAARRPDADLPIRVAIGFGVDTARSPNREILALYGGRERTLAHAGAGRRSHLCSSTTTMMVDAITIM
jgi:hypothetical protein